MKTASHSPQATGYKPLAALFRLPGRGRPARPRSGVHAARTAKTPPLPSYHHELRAVGRPVTITMHHEPRTTNPLADTQVRPYDKMELHEPQTASH